MFGKRKYVTGLLAQSLYEDLPAEERRALDEALERDPGLRAEAEALREFVRILPASPVDFEGDLRQAVLRELDEREQERRRYLPHWAIALAAFVAVAGAVVYWIVAHPPAAVAPRVAQQVAPEVSPVEIALDRADALLRERQYARAYAVLAEATAGNPQDRRAGVAYQRMADLAYSELHWYPEAFAAYDVLRTDYVTQFERVPANFTRLNLLDEARGPRQDYASLRALDAAKRDGSFEALEEVVASHPATYVASAAAEEMAGLVAKEEGFVAEGRDLLRAMRMAQARSRNPVVKTQLQVETAHVAEDVLGNDSQARRIYEEVAQGSITVLAELAQKRLAEMDAQPEELRQ